MQQITQFIVLAITIILLIKIVEIFTPKKNSSIHPDNVIGSDSNKYIESSQQEYLPFVRKPSILTNVEKRYFRQLEEMYGQTHYIFPQVGLDKLVHTNDQKNFYSYWNKINRKSIDFVLVDKQTLETTMLIELNDYTHSFAKRKERDEFLRKVCDKAGIELHMM